MSRELIYRNIAYFCALFLVVGLFIDFKDDNASAIFDLVYDFVAISTFTFAYLWNKRLILLIGLGFYAIDWNMDLLINPIIQVDNQTILNSQIGWISLGFNLVGYTCLLVGFANKFNHRILTKVVNLDIRATISLILIFTLLFQMIFRIVV